ncbi:MAG: ribosomal protein L11 methyltransferase [Chloroflexi bacterium RBG_16_54_18]|nr:MAG: ribosomal protein L11 methyltransferase [Chloroflexi bacterium RBG_16_54_18]
MRQWLEISLEVDGELAEAVAEVLRRFIPDGVVIESTSIISQADDTEGKPTGPLRVYGYLPVDDELKVKRQSLDEALWYLGRIRPLPPARTRIIEDQNWAESWKQHYQPILIGSRLLIIPAWLEAADRERIPIRIDPGMAFGTGTHPSTQLCLEILEDLCQPPETRGYQDWEVIDLGCGTAILAIAALKLGASQALAVDTDPQAIAAARQNAEANGVSDRLELGLGSLAEIRAGAHSIHRAPVVVVNILAPVIVRLIKEGLEELLADDGRLVLAGILEEQASEVIEEARRAGLSLSEQRQVGDWVALVF